MKILFVITGLGLGGAEKQICLLADRFSDAQHQVTIISLTGEAIITPDSENIKIHCLNMKKTPFGFVSTLYKLRQLVERIKPDVVHSHMFHANIMMRLVRLFTRWTYKLICTAHSKNEGGELRMRVYQLTDSLCDINTNVSQEALDEFIAKKSFSKSKSFVVYNGIDTDKFRFDQDARTTLRESLGITHTEKLMLTVGRLTPAKDYPNLLAAFRLLPEDYKLIIIGEGEVRETIESTIDKYKLASRVQLLGGINSVSRYYSACDLFVLSSAWEGFGLVVAEAMACQRVCVCTDAGGVREVIGDNNFVVPVSNSKMLAEKIMWVDSLTSEQKSVIEAQNRNHVINNFSITSVVERWLKIYTAPQVDK